MISVNIAGFAVNPMSKEPVMLLKRSEEPDPPTRLVPVTLGPVEAHAILSVLQGAEHPRPMTHDLMTNIMTTLQAELRRVDIHSFNEGTFFASLVFVQNGVTFVVDSRPSDAVALAVRRGAPVFIDEAVFEATSVETNVVTVHIGGGGDPEKAAQILTDIHNFAENVQPGDFSL